MDGGTGLFCNFIEYDNITNLCTPTPGSTTQCYQLDVTTRPYTAVIEQTDQFNAAVDNCAISLIENNTYNGMIIFRKPKEVGALSQTTINCMATDRSD